MPTLLIVEDEDVLARNLTKYFTRQGFEVHRAPTLAAAREMLPATPPDVVLLDLRLPDGSGIDFLSHVVATDADVPVLMMTAYGSVADAVRAMQQGARDYVQKPLDLDEIGLKVTMALRAARERREIAYYRERQATGSRMVGESPAVQRLRALVERLNRATGPAGGPAPTVLLLGETGTGKGHAARALHAGGGRREGPFIEVNCTALPDSLVESELFGHEKGAFTDAKSARAGLFETADGGTIFLDEIGDLTGPLQSKFLKVIEEKSVRRVGATASRQVDVAIIAATSRDLEAAVRAGTFREDLYQRLSVAVLHLPPLRERERDAVLLARLFLADTCRRYGMPVRTLSPEAEEAIVHHPWPGNVREVANTMERAVLFSDATVLRVEDLGLPGAAPATEVRAGEGGALTIDLGEEGASLEAIERALLVRALEKAGGNQSAAARMLGISRHTLRYRMEKFGLG